MKKIISLCLVLMLVLSMVPSVSAAVFDTVERNEAESTKISKKQGETAVIENANFSGGQAVELIKATAVVGYIAVNDLTKMGDIIRSNTYEAFFPLIATAVIYFVLTWVLSFLLGFLKKRFEPKRRSKEDILKGVKTV